MVNAQDTSGAPPAPEAVYDRTPRWVFEVMLMIAVAVAAFLPYAAVELRPAGPMQWVLCLLPVPVMLWRRSFPLVVLGICAVVFAAAAVAGVVSLGGGIAVAAAVFEWSLHGPKHLTTGTAVIAAAVVMAFSVWNTWGAGFDPRMLLFGLLVGFAAAAASALRSRREYLTAVVDRARRLEQNRDAEIRHRVSEERLSIARDLHDTVAHQIAVISLTAGVAASALDARPERTREALTTIRDASRTVVREIGDLLRVLRDDTTSLSPAPRADHIDGLVARFHAAGHAVRYEVDGHLHTVTDPVGTVLYRIVQEALTNCHKHGAGGTVRVRIRISIGHEITVIINNPTAGPAAAPSGTGFGLTGLHERVATVRGTLTAGPTPDGWELTARLPAPQTVLG